MPDIITCEIQDDNIGACVGTEHVDVQLYGVDTSGMSMIVDQTYNATSAHAQSGVAVAQAVEGKADSATTLSGYGITNAYTKTETDTIAATKVNKSDLPNLCASGIWQKASGSVAQCYPVSESRLETAVTIADVDRSAVSPTNPIAIPSYTAAKVTRCGRNIAKSYSQPTYAIYNDILDVEIESFNAFFGKQITISFVSDSAGKVYENENVFTTSVSKNVVVGANSITLTVKPNVAAGALTVSNGKWRLLKNFVSTNTCVFTNVQISVGFAAPYEPYTGQTYTMSTDTAVYPGDIVRDDAVVHNMGYIASYNGETITGDYISSTGSLTTGAQVAYKLSQPYTTPRDTPIVIPALATADKYTPQINTVFSDAGNVSVGYNMDGTSAYNTLTAAIVAQGGNV